MADQKTVDDTKGGTLNLDELSVALDQCSVPELAMVIQMAEAKRRDRLEGAKTDLLAEFRDRAGQMGLSLETLLSTPAPTEKARKSRKDAGGNLPVKYRGPNGETWSGRGRLPKWLHVMEAEGRNREEFKV
jgi:DNA-binding protein H-NS